MPLPPSSLSLLDLLYLDDGGLPVCCMFFRLQMMYTTFLTAWFWFLQAKTCTAACATSPHEWHSTMHRGSCCPAVYSLHSQMPSLHSNLQQSMHVASEQQALLPERSPAVFAHDGLCGAVGPLPVAWLARVPQQHLLPASKGPLPGLEPQMTTLRQQALHVRIADSDRSQVMSWSKPLSLRSLFQAVPTNSISWQSV